MDSLEELQAILDKRPEGATHITNDGTYLLVDGFYVKVFNTLNAWSVPVCNVESVFIDSSPRLISDIQRIVDLMTLNQNMHTAVAGYLYSKDWEHWNEFNAGKFKL